MLMFVLVIRCLPLDVFIPSCQPRISLNVSYVVATLVDPTHRLQSAGDTVFLRSASRVEALACSEPL
jgi:NADH:ubiquinone oxidoreductase subunit B-like Fe-S oxidoreductase